MPDFNSEYQKLNAEQKLAVDTIEGPVMVIAGAGTGKTQTIALRIGQILNQSQVNPSNILCLTFTESAAINMRQRLLSLIGPSSYSVRIATFHGFCNSVIKDNPEYFLLSLSESTALDDVTQIEVVQKLIDKLPGNCSLKNLNFPYFYQKDIIRSISTLKKENISTDQFEILINQASDFIKIATPVAEKLAAIRASAKAEVEIKTIINNLINDTDLNILYRAQLQYFQSQDLSLSELKKSIRDFIDKTTTSLPKQQDLLTLYRGYQKSLTDQNLYDYEDMILWVINAYKNNPQLLAQYQETYQYLLVDEFQDTNSSQFEIINLLTQNQDNPNIFVVGDDDQSIYRFQGASVENVYTFYQKYKSTLKVIVLKNNYRSHRLILETSNQVISNNQNRITQYIDKIDKSLVSVQTYDPDPINIIAVKSAVEENFLVAQKIKDLLTSGTKPQEIAVLYRANADVDDLIPFLAQQNISYLRSDHVNILDNIYIQQLITLLKYLFGSKKKSELAKILSFKFIGIPSLDLYKYFHHQEISPKAAKKIDKFRQRVAYIEKQKTNLPPDQLFNLVIRRFKFLKFVLRHADLDLLKQLNALYSHLKNALRIEKIDLKSWVKSLELLQENTIALNSAPLISEQESSIRLMTVHKAKGLEFEHVFLIKVLSGKWDGASSRTLIKLPLGILKTDITKNIGNSDLEEDRRLFYVALTRAKKQIYISYSIQTDTGREQLPSVFVNEIDTKLIDLKTSSQMTEKLALYHQFDLSLPHLTSTSLKDYLTNYLTTQYRFNITHLNSYLKCPLCFFFRTILRLPQAKTRSLSFGTSVHGALAYLYQYHLPLEKFLEIFDKNLLRENLSKTDYKDLLAQGHEILTDYFNHYQNNLDGKYLIEHDFKTFNVRLNDIPLTGKIDRMDILPDNKVNVVDYKTGKPDSKYKELSKDGDYFRQLVFYKLLCDNAHGFKYHVASGSIDFVQKDNKGNFKKSDFDITIEDTDKLSALITETFKKITALEFPVGPDCDDTDHLHYLFDKYFK